MVGREATLYALWATGLVNIEFEKNAPEGISFSGNMNPQEIPVGFSTTLKTNSFYRWQNDYAFNGWNTAADGSGTTYADGAAVQFSVDTVLYAQWTNEITITFDRNGATGGSMSDIDTTIGSEITIPACGYIRDGYVFAAWSIQGGEPGNYYDVGESLTVSGDYGQEIVFVPYWQQVFTVTLNLNGGTYGGEATVESWQIDAGETIYLDEPEKLGYCFGYWYIGADDGKNQFGAYEDYEPASDITVNAFFMPIKYRICFDLDGGSTADGDDYNPLDAIFDGTYTIPEDYVPTLEGYEFNGWIAYFYDIQQEEWLEETLLPGSTYDYNLTDTDDAEVWIIAYWHETGE